MEKKRRKKKRKENENKEVTHEQFNLFFFVSYKSPSEGEQKNGREKKKEENKEGTHERERQWRFR